MSCKFFSISTQDYIQNTCLHYIDEMELVLCHPRLWLLHDEYYPTQLSLLIQCLRDFHILFFAKLLSLLLPLQSLQNFYYYFCHSYHDFHTTLLLNTFLQILSLTGVIELITQLLILVNIICLPCAESINLGWILYPQKLLCSPILVSYLDLFWRCCWAA